MKDKEIQAINKLNNIFKDLPTSFISQEINNNVQILVQGINELDQEVKQKTFEVKNREQLLVQRDNLLVQKDQILVQKEQKVVDLQKTVFADILHKLYPDSYSAKVEEWPDTLPMKKHVVNNDVYVMEKNTAIYKPLIEKKEKETIKKEFVKSLNELYPDSYSINPNEWFYKDGKPLPMKVHYDNNHFEVMIKNTLYYKTEIEEIKAKKLEEAKKLKEENLKKDQLLVQKDQLILTKELEKQELSRQKEIEKQELKKEMLAQKEVELANKSLVKNQVIGELQGDIDFKEKESYKLQIELLTKQLEFKSKESELKEKALADAHIINELQGKLLAFKDLSKHDETLKLELSVIHFKVEESILNGNVDEMKELSKYLSQLMKNPLEKDESLEISELLNNLSLRQNPPLLNYKAFHVINGL